MRLNFSQARRVASKSFWRAPWPRPRFMNGKSNAHQARPITGTQISSCLRKNFRNGILPWKMRCNTRMSTQLWWFADTRYQPRECRSATPCTSHSAGRTAAIQLLLIATQAEANAVSAWSQARRNAGSGSSLSSAGSIISAVSSTVLSVSVKAVKAPRKAAGRRASIRGSPSLSDLQHRTPRGLAAGIQSISAARGLSGSGIWRARTRFQGPCSVPSRRGRHRSMQTPRAPPAEAASCPAGC